MLAASLLASQFPRPHTHSICGCLSFEVGISDEMPAFQVLPGLICVAFKWGQHLLHGLHGLRTAQAVPSLYPCAGDSFFICVWPIQEDGPYFPTLTLLRLDQLLWQIPGQLLHILRANYSKWKSKSLAASWCAKSLVWMPKLLAHGRPSQESSSCSHGEPQSWLKQFLFFCWLLVGQKLANLEKIQNDLIAVNEESNCFI